MKRLLNIRVLCIALCACAMLAGLLIAGCARSGSTPADTQKSDSDEVLVSAPVEEIDYASGIHHAELVFEGYESSPLSIEVYSHSAPVTAEKFCRLVDSGFYNGKPVFWILNEMYLRVGTTQQDNDFLITGEYEESEVKNSNSLKRGVIAMNRAADGQQSDASSLIIFMSDLSFLDGKYAGFAKIVENYEVIEEIAKRTTAADGELRIIVDDNGRIIDEAQYPHIKTIAMID
ncbi:MAG: peptidylprolyl isomerase [Coriobacteriales bacterium]